MREIFDALQQMNESGMTIVVVEQNATLALRAAKHAYVLETGRVVLGGVAADLQANESVRRSYLGVLATAAAWLTSSSRSSAGSPPAASTARSRWRSS